MFIKSLMDLQDLVDCAGRAILSARARGISVVEKPDGSPATAADLVSERILTSELSRRFPEIPILSEESSFAESDFGCPHRFFLVDPLDGTRDFIAGRDEFTVNIALVEDGQPVFGMIGAPATGRLFMGVASVGAFERRNDGSLEKLICRGEPRDSLVVLVSRSHLDAASRQALLRLPSHVLQPLGSSLKFALVAAGEADLYLRLGPTMAWDTAAGHAIVEAAGGVVLSEQGSRLEYLPAHGLRNPGFVASTSMEYARLVVAGESRTTVELKPPLGCV